MNKPEVKIPRSVKGKESTFFDDPAIDQVMTFFTELMTELSVLRDRVDTLERVLEDHSIIPPAAVDTYRHSEESEARRAALRKAFLQRVLRVEP
jgi:hypothetical protein